MRKLFYFFTLIVLFSCSGDGDETSCSPTPDLTTNEVTEITSNSAVVSGVILPPTCESTTTSQGLVYSDRIRFPKIEDDEDKVAERIGKNISANLSYLEPNTKHYVRTFFVNPTGVYYGNVVEFKTEIGNIVITTKNIDNVTSNSAKSGGIITYDGGANIISRGVCWSASENPTIDDFKTVDGSGIGNFNSELTGLSENTKYYVRAYTTNENGTTYGNEESFTTSKLTYKVELQITGYINSCNVQAPYFYYELNYKFDDNDLIFEGAEGFEGTSYNHSKTGMLKNNLEVTIHLAQFNPDNPSLNLKGAYLDNMSIVITNLNSNQVALNTPLPSLFICTDTAYKNIINFNPQDGSYTIDRLTYGF
ncbi:hypothetical protein EC396_13360 [Lutibacter sp. HS1-25]|uniref:hypothetical protein n=1 Tax=Lutibacter sp. HS1-25 TaxID=2485000 RepID=UPI0010112DD4|nr:hypothetical protein [Lutibacter sp. HS1-25]RXP46863.1 hypothetical protein EC396_13360 [Lutibacter sp. HS1-25]